MSGPTQPEPSLIYDAARTGDVAGLRRLLESGHDVDEKEPFNGSTPLIGAASFGHLEVVDALLDAGAAIDARDDHGSTALHVAALFCHPEIVELLLTRGADKSLRQNAGPTALELVTTPFETMKGIYRMLAPTLEPYGLDLSLERLEVTRPVIARMLE